MPVRFNLGGNAAVLQPVRLLLVALLLLVPTSHAFAPTPSKSISSSTSTSIYRGKHLSNARTSNTCPPNRHPLVRCWSQEIGVQPPSPPPPSPSKPLSTSSPTLPAGTWPPKGFRPFRSLREESGDVSLDLDEHQQSLVTPPTSQFFAGFRLRELDEINKNTFLKETGRVQQGLRGLVWFAYLLWPYIGFGVFCSLIAQLIVYNMNGVSPDDASFLTPLDVKDFPDLKIVHGFVGSILGFSIGFRTNAAYDRYYEGRKILSTILENSRSIIRDVYSFTLKAPPCTSVLPSLPSSSSPVSAPDDAAVLVISNDIRRRLDILFAFIRQSVRESLIGFSPDTDMAAVPFTNTTYYLDPSFPLLLDLLSKEEATRYAKLSPRSRPGAVSAEINIILQILGARIQYVDAFLGKVQGHLSRITEAQSTMLRIRDTPVPYPYLLILNVATFIFVYSTPFLYNTGVEGRYFGVQLLVVAYYGILSIGQSIENPYAWDTFDIDFEGFAIQLSRDLSTIANCLQDDRAAFLQELVHPPEMEEEGEGKKE